MNRPQPDATVVVPTRNRRGRLEALLRSLAELEGATFETVVVDDASSDGTHELLRNGVMGLDLRSIRQEQPQGPAAARNAGWRAGEAPLVVFIDDDMAVDRRWLTALIEEHRRNPQAILQGHTEPDPDELARSSVFWRSMRVEGVDKFAPACNIAYPRELLERIGGFDEEAFTRAMGEDTDLAWRALKQGSRLVYVEGAHARHAVHQYGVVGALRDTRRILDMVSVVRRHPELRDALHHRVFLDPHQERVLGLLAGLALARRTRGASLLLGLPYARLYRPGHAGWGGTLAALPAYATVDLVRLAGLAAMSARQRTVLL